MLIELDFIWKLLCSDSIELVEMEELKIKIINEIDVFKKQLETKQIHHEASNFVYCLCAVLDERIMTNYVAYRDIWSKNTLVMWCGGNVNSGEKFFDLYDSFSSSNESIRELKYALDIFISLGFQGSRQDYIKNRSAAIVTKKPSIQFNPMNFENKLFRSLAIISALFFIPFLLFIALDIAVYISHFSVIDSINAAGIE